MKLKALSHYDNDQTTRFGDCILLYSDSTLVVYDCGHNKHKEYVENFLKTNYKITAVNIVVSHNDSDHTEGVIPLLDYLYINRSKYTVRVYSSLYLKDVDKILELLDDKRRTRESTKKNILETFDKIKEIVEKAEEYNFTVFNAEVDTEIPFASSTIVGPTVDEFVEVVAQAIEDNEVTQIEGETVMNAASVQLRCKSDDMKLVLLCGDASPSYLHNLDDYDVIQLPHHGNLDNAERIFGELANAGSKTFLVSDNTGATNGGSDDLMKSDARKGKCIKNTQNGVVDLPDILEFGNGNSKTKSGIIIPSTHRTGGYGCDIL
jgi:ribonuclease BN (tRNA processing enzyme)